MRETRRESGATVIFALGILTLMSLFAVSFASITSLERAASANYMDGVRAEMAARAGLERAIAELRKDALDNRFDHPGEEWAFLQGSELGWMTPLPDHDEDLDGRRLSFDTDGDGKSGIASGTYTQGGDYYLVKVLDCAGQYDLNSHLPADLFEEQLAALGAEIAGEYGVTDPIGGDSGAETIRTYRTDNGGYFNSKEDLLVPLTEIHGSEDAAEEHLATLWDFVTVHTWRDGTQAENVDPALLSSTPIHNPNAEDAAVLPRASINLNTASKPVLVAMLVGMDGLLHRLKNHNTARQYLGSTPKTIERRSIPGDALTASDARTVADAIIARRAEHPFDGKTSGGNEIGTAWDEFRLWVIDSLGTGGGEIPYRYAPYLLVGLNPSPTLPRVAADPPRFVLGSGYENENFARAVEALVDKADMKSGPVAAFSSMGFFEIVSYGRLEDEDGNLLAEHRVMDTVQLYEIYRHNTQLDFERAKEDSSENVMTFPAHKANQPSRMAGWVSLWPDSFSSGSDTFYRTWDEDYGGGTSGTPPSTDFLTPEGVFQTRKPVNGQNKEVAYGTAPNWQQGSCEFWVKIPFGDRPGLISGGFDGDVSLVRAADEPWVVTVTHAPNSSVSTDTTNQHPGGAGGDQPLVCWRLERQGTKLISTRFYAGHPSYAIPDEAQVPVVFSEVVVDISDWRPGEWHHIYHEWTQAAKHLHLFVDEVDHVTASGVFEMPTIEEKYTYNPQTYSEWVQLDPIRAPVSLPDGWEDLGPEADDVTAGDDEWLGGQSDDGTTVEEQPGWEPPEDDPDAEAPTAEIQWVLIDRWAIVETQSYQFETSIYNHFKLLTNSPDERVCIGGYMWNKSSSEGDVHRLSDFYSLPGTGTRYRFSTVVMDEFRFTSASRQPVDRYIGDGTFQGSFSVAPGGVAAHVWVQGRYPMRWRDVDAPLVTITNGDVSADGDLPYTVTLPEARSVGSLKPGGSGVSLTIPPAFTNVTAMVMIPTRHLAKRTLD